MTAPVVTPMANSQSEAALPACVMVFNANDPSGAGGLAADVGAMASVGAHALPVLTGAYARDTAQIFDHFALDDEAVTEQARAVLEDIAVRAFKLGFVGSPENLAAVAAVVADYCDAPLIAYLPDLSWWDDIQIERYLDAFKELILPQTTVLVGSHSTLWRWLLPDWSAEHRPGARDIARAAQALGAPCTLVTGMLMADGFMDNVMASGQAVLVNEKFERFEGTFSGAGDTLSAAFAALLASGDELAEAFTEALSYLDRCLAGGFRPGMGSVVPDRLFWAEPSNDPAPGIDPSSSFSSTISSVEHVTP